MPATRLEVAEPETAAARLTSWIAAGPDADGGPTIVATTADGARDYPLNKAVLDPMMTMIAIDD